MHLLILQHLHVLQVDKQGNLNQKKANILFAFFCNSINLVYPPGGHGGVEVFATAFTTRLNSELFASNENGVASLKNA